RSDPTARARALSGVSGRDSRDRQYVRPRRGWLSDGALRLAFDLLHQCADWIGCAGPDAAATDASGGGTVEMARRSRRSPVFRSVRRYDAARTGAGATGQAVCSAAWSGPAV